MAPTRTSLRIRWSSPWLSARRCRPSSAATPTRCSRRCVSITQIHAGSAYNVIPDTAHLAGTVRTFDDETCGTSSAAHPRDLRRDRRRFGASIEVDIREVFSVLRNDPEKSGGCRPRRQASFSERLFSTGRQRRTWAARTSPICCSPFPAPIAGSAWTQAAGAAQPELPLRRRDHSPRGLSSRPARRAPIGPLAPARRVCRSLNAGDDDVLLTHLFPYGRRALFLVPFVFHSRAPADP